MKKRIRDWGVPMGTFPCGRRNKITDVPGVLVGHRTVEQEEEGIHTGVTVILPAPDNVFSRKCPAAAYVHNGFGKTCGLPQIEELGTLETPIALTNTLNVGLVADALVEYTLDRCKAEGKEAFSINPVVGECNDSQINCIAKRAVGKEDVMAAIRAASEEFEEGAVGAGTGTICYQLKGGIGSASRLVRIGEKDYVIGVLVQSNFGVARCLTVAGRQPSFQEDSQAEDRGSIMMICATDLPLSDRQLKRLIRRMGNGLARTGSYTGHGSGEIMIGFSTANRVQDGREPAFLEQTVLNENLMNSPFEAVAEATEEAVLNSMAMAEAKKKLDGSLCRSLADFLPLQG